MTSQGIVEKIVAENPQVTEEQVLEKLQAERDRTGGLLADDTLLRLIAARYGVKVEQRDICNSGILSTARLLAGLNDVTVAGRLIALYPVRAFTGEKPGKYAPLMVADTEGTLRVVLWNEKADLVEKGELSVGQTVRLMHGYTRKDRNGNVELHMGAKSVVEVEAPEKSSIYPTVEKYITKIGSLRPRSGTVHLSGTVEEVYALRTFTRDDSTDGAVMRFILCDESGKATAVAWNGKATELKSMLKPGVHLTLVNARLKDTQEGTLEIHIDQSTYVQVSSQS